MLELLAQNSVYRPLRQDSSAIELEIGRQIHHNHQILALLRSNTHRSESFFSSH